MAKQITRSEYEKLQKELDYLKNQGRDEIAQKLQEAQTEAETLRRENAVMKAGVNTDDADYVLFKVGKMEGDFGDNLKKFLEENPKYKTEPTKKVPDGKHEPSRSDNMDGVEAAFRKRNPDLKFDD